MKCRKCNNELQSAWSVCPFCGERIMNTDYSSPVGVWRVTTEGDCEGRTTTRLGDHEGHIIDIARHLAKSAYYSLRFEKILSMPKQNLAASPASSVSISLSINSGTWDMKRDERVKFFKKMMEVDTDPRGLQFEILPGQYYASVIVKFKD